MDRVLVLIRFRKIIQTGQIIKATLELDLGVDLEKLAMADLEDAIQITQEAIRTIPEDHPQRAGLLSILGISLGERYFRAGAIADLEEAIQVVR